MFGVRKSDLKVKLRNKSELLNETESRFRCAVCGDWHLFGRFIKIKNSILKGFSIKVCNCKSCLKKAYDGLDIRIGYVSE